MVASGIVEFVVFRGLANANPKIEKALPILLGSAGFSVILGIVLIFI